MKCKFPYLVILTCLILSACQSNPEEVILGKWVLDKEAMQDMLNQEIGSLKEHSPTSTQSVEKNTMALTEITFVFKQDGSLSMISQGVETKGKWLIDANGKTLETTDENNQKIQASIEEISKSSMVLKLPVQDNIQTFVFKKVE